MKKLTMGHPIVMGRKTFESIGRVLPSRTNIVISRTLSLHHILIYDVEKVIVCDSLEKGIEAAKNAPGSDEIFIFGGEQIFKEALEKRLVDKSYLTWVEGNYNADTFFPEYSEFKIVNEEAREERDYKFKFQELDKN